MGNLPTRLVEPHILLLTPFPPFCPSTPSSSPSSHSSISAASAYPRKAKPALLTCALYGTRHLDNAVRYLRDAQPNKRMDHICILGVKHSSYEPLQRTASRGCSCTRARGGSGWAAWWGGGGAPSVSTRSGYKRTSSSRRAPPTAARPPLSRPIPLRIR